MMLQRAAFRTPGFGLTGSCYFRFCIAVKQEDP